MLRCAVRVRVQRVRNIDGPVQEIRIDRLVLRRRPQQFGVDRRRRVVRAGPKLVIRYRLLGRRFGAAGSLFTVERHCDDVLADRQPVAMAQPMRRLEPAVASIEKRAIGRDVIEPVAAVAVAHLAVLAGDVARRVGQGPIEVLIAADIDHALAGHGHAERAAVRQAGFVLDGQRQPH